jgi:hypothetical protein
MEQSHFNRLDDGDNKSCRAAGFLFINGYEFPKSLTAFWNRYEGLAAKRVTSLQVFIGNKKACLFSKRICKGDGYDTDPG